VFCRLKPGRITGDSECNRQEKSPQAWRITEFKDSRGGSFPFERKMWLMLVGLLLSLLELSKLILFALHRPGSIDLFGIGGVTLFSSPVTTEQSALND